MGCNQPKLFFCIRTAPVANLEASVSRRKGLVMSGIIRTG